MSAPVDAPRGSPWHDGERALQRRIGADHRLERIGRVVLRRELTEQHRAFYPDLPFIVTGAVDPAGDVWASVRTGEPGFLTAPDTGHLVVDGVRDRDDPAERGMETGDAVGFLGIDLATRRRNRLNGTVRREGPERFAVAVEQSFGNCPRYIHSREIALAPVTAGDAEAPVVGDHLDAAAQAMVAGADTLFVASFIDDQNGKRQVDVSHRGGASGFIGLDATGMLTIPDYAGNMFFNTLGNLVLNPRAGLLIVHGATGDTLQIMGEAAVLLDAPEVAAYPGAELLWQVRPRRVVRRVGGTRLRWQSLQANAPTSR